MLDFEQSDRFDERQKTALLYTSMLVWNPEGVDGALWSRLREHFSDPELVELTFLIGFINMLNLFNNLLGVRYNGEYSVLKPAAD